MLTLVGDAFPRRVGASLLAHAGLGRVDTGGDAAAGGGDDAVGAERGEEAAEAAPRAELLLLASSDGEFEDVAVRLAATAGGRAALRALRRRLVEASPTAPLFDTMRFAHEMERAYHAMWDAHLAGVDEADARAQPPTARAVRHVVLGSA